MLNWTASGFLLLAFWFLPEAEPYYAVPNSQLPYSRAACALIVDAGPDTNVCAPGGLIQLMGSITGNPLFYQWTPYNGLNDPFILDPIADITGPITYTLSAYGIDPTNPNLVINGDFSAGNMGFTTDYNYVVDIPGLQNEMVPEGTYTVGPNPNLVHTGFSACSDHTGGGGDMLIVNGAASFQDVWCQTIPLDANNYYDVSAWVASVNPSSPAELQFSINGTPIGPIINASPTTCIWTPFNATWYSGSNTSAEICILNLNTAAGGNDFAIDDISIVELCKVEDEVDITLYFEQAPLPIIDGPAFLCEGETGVYTATFPPNPTINSYLWTVPSGATILSGQGTTEITVLWEDMQVGEVCLEIETRCDMNEACFEVSVGFLPEFPLISGPTSLCPGEIGVFYTTEVDPDDVYLWTIPSNLIIISGQGTNEIEVEWAAPGEIEICVEVSNACGSIDNCSLLTLWPDYLTLMDTTICEGETIEINGTIYGNGILTGTETFIAISGCDSIVEIEITETATLEYMITNNLCPGDSIFLEGAYQMDEGIYTDTFYTIAGCDSIVITELIITAFDTTWINALSCLPADTGVTIITYTQGLCDSTVVTQTSLAPTDTMELVMYSCLPADTGTISMLLTNQFGCDSLIRTTTLLSPSDSNFIYQTTCDPAQVGIDIQKLTNINGCDSVVITTIDFVLSDTTLIVQPSCLISDTGTVSTLLTNSMGCDSLVIVNTFYGGSDTTFLNATTCNPVDSGFTYTTLLNQYLCDSIITLFTELLEMDTTYLSGSSCLPQDTGVFEQVLTNVNGCDSTIITTITLLPVDDCSIEVEFEVIQPLCFGDTGLIIVTTEIGLAPFVINWEHADLGINGTESISANPGSAELELTTGGIYFIEVKSANGLSIFDTIAISAIPPLVVSLTVPADQFGYNVSCYGDSSAMAISNLDEIGTPPYNYQWSNGSDAGSLTMLGAGIYSLTVTDVNGCTTSASVAVTEPALMAYVVASMNITCHGMHDGSISLSGITGGVSPWLTSINGQSFSEVLNYNSLDPGQYQLVIMDQNGCMAEEVVLIEEPEAWSISLGLDTSVIFGNSVDLEINVLGMPTGMLQTQWSDGLCANCFSRNITPATTTIYSVTAIDDNGCTDEDDIHVRVTIDRNLYIPNVFSPNGDQINDLFSLHTGAGLEEIEIMSIFDRWGNLVFQATHFHPNDLSGAWDGTMNGKYLNPGVYVYTVTAVFLDGVKAIRYGDVSLIR